MGELAVQPILNEEARQRFMQQLVSDIRALEKMLQGDFFERGRQRIGAEQEICLIDDEGWPSLVGPDILGLINDPHFTTEIARFNLEINLDPFELRSDCLRKTERQLLQLLGHGSGVASDVGARFLLTGILPSLQYRNLSREHMTPQTRYYVLDEVMRAHRRGDFEIRILGADELIASHPSMFFEGCTTSFQLHLQIDPEEYVEAYNWAQLISGPVLAAATNSPLLFGRELWAESRIALFQQSIDTRRSANCLRERQSRVYFGTRWLRDSIVDLFKEHAVRFPPLLTREIDDDTAGHLQAGRAPALTALRTHNGTVYTWNRPCYGVVDGRAHLRIECRYLPSGPTVADEMANFALWLGVMKGMPREYRGFYRHMNFKEARENFYRAAGHGLHALLCWFGQEKPAARLILEDLLPIARQGLEQTGINQGDIDRHLGLIERRVATYRTGSRWQTTNFRRLTERYGAGVAVVALTQAMRRRQESGQPVHAWPDIDTGRVYAIDGHRDRVGQFMRTDLYVVGEEEPLGFVKAIMEWKNIRHLPVEDDEGNLIGLVTATNLRAFGQQPEDWETVPIRQIMVRQLVTVTSDTPIKSAARVMTAYGVGCLPVVEGGKLLGMITDTDMKRLNLLE